MRYEREGSVNSNEGGAVRSGKREFYTAIALLVMVFVAAGALFAVPAWSQGKDGKESKEVKSTKQKSSSRAADSAAARSAQQNRSAREARNKGKGKSKGKGRGRGTRIIVVDGQYGQDDDLNNDGVISQQEQLESAENDLDDETTDGETTDGETTDGDEFDSSSDDSGDSGVSATADENGAEASTPGASASAGGDPDEQAPVTGPQGNVVDEIPTSGPLPETGGAPVATGTVLALVLFGAGLLAVRLVMLKRAEV